MIMQNQDNKNDNKRNTGLGAAKVEKLPSNMAVRSADRSGMVQLIALSQAPLAVLLAKTTASPCGVKSETKVSIQSLAMYLKY